MKILGKVKVLAACFMVSACLFAPSVPAHAAGTIAFKYLDGTELNATISSSQTGFAAADNEIKDAGYEVIGYIYDDCRQALQDHSDITGDTTLTAVTTRDVTEYGPVGSGVTYFIYNNKLYLTGVKGTATLGGTAQNAEISKKRGFTGLTYDIEQPSIQYGDIDGAGYGIAGPALGDEDSVSDGEYYKYTEPSNTSLSIGDVERASDISYKLAGFASNKDGFIAHSAPWASHAQTITDIYISDDVALTGSLNFMFNGNQAQTVVGGISESIYKSLKHVYLFGDTSGVTSAAGMFARCPQLEGVYVREGALGLDLSKCTSTAFMFLGDENLQNGEVDPEHKAVDAVNVISVKNGALTDSSYMFAMCSSIRQPSVSTYNMTNVASTEGMFLGCTEAGLLCDQVSSSPSNVGGWVMPNNIDASLMFCAYVPTTSEGAVDYAGFSGLVETTAIKDIDKSVVSGNADISGMKLTKLKDAYLMFAYNSQLGSIRFSDAYPQLENTANMFMGCSNLTGAELGGAQFPVLKDATAMFRGAGKGNPGGIVNLSSVSMPVLKYAGLMFESAGFSTINMATTTDFSSLIEAKAMFAGNRYLSELGSGAFGNANFANLKSAKYMFMGNESLSSVDTKNWNMEKCEDMSFMFSGCKSLSEGVDLSLWKVTSTLKTMECFAQGSEIKAADMSGWKPSELTNAFMAFASNSSLTEAKMPSVSMNALKVANGMFYNDSALASVSAMPSCPVLSDARGMFAMCPSLKSFDGGNLVTGGTEAVSFMFMGNEALLGADLSSWNTGNVKYMEGLFDGCAALNELKVSSSFSGANLVTIAKMFKGCEKLTDESLKEVTKSLSSTAKLVDASEAFMNMYALTELDLTALDFSSATELNRLAMMAEKEGEVTNRLVTIKVPSSLLSAEGASTKNADGTSINMFWVDGDGTSDGQDEEDGTSDDLLTNFYVAGEVNSRLAAYDFGGANKDNDNRTFMIFKERTINGEDTGIHSSKDNKDAVLKIGADTTFYVGEGTKAEKAKIGYAWTKDGSAEDGNENSHKASKGGTYHVNALPEVLTGSNTPADATFVIGGKITEMTATYEGATVSVGTNYSKDDVSVVLIDDTKKKFVLKSSDFAVDSQLVRKKGDNQYVASYKSGAQTLTANFLVPGERHIGSIAAEYTGPSVDVGKDYGTDYVVVTAYYADDTDKKDGITVKATSFSSTKVEKAGDNEYTVTYVDAEQNNKEFKANITVNGYKAIKSIKAKYVGGAVKVGGKYKKKDVRVTLKYKDGTSEKTKNFSLDSTLVSFAGKNTFKATFTDPYGKTFSDKFTVEGLAEGESGETSGGNSDNSSEDISVVSNDDTGFVSSTVYAPDTQAAGYSEYGSATGIVQTGRTEKGIFALLICALFGAGSLVLVLAKKRLKDGEEI